MLNKKKTSRKLHKKKAKNNVIQPPVISKPIIQTTQAEPANTQALYTRSKKNAPCPKCGSFPCVTVSRSAKTAVLRCRECGHRFEVQW